MSHLGDANKMVSDTPRTDAEYERLFEIYQNAERINGPLCCAFENDMRLCRQLERELNAANDRIKHLRDGIAKQNQTIEQACGTVLGYPWFKDDQKNFPGATEKDGVCVGDHVAETIVSELAKRHTEALARIKRLEEAGDGLMKSINCGCPYGPSVFNCQTCTNSWDAWRKSKEDKP